MSTLPSSEGVSPVEVFALPTGELSHPDRWLFEDGDEDIIQARHAYPDYSFLIRHASGQNILFDLGLAKATNITQPKAPEDATDILRRGPVDPESISTVIFSHLHFDHVGDCTKFPHAKLIAGPSSAAANGEGWPANPKSPNCSAPIQHPGYQELTFDGDTWKPLGPFERAYDFFGDGSLFLIDTPGHMPGHLGALALTGQNEWVFMGGDCCHHRSLLVGARPMSITCGPAGQKSFHKEPDVAAKTIEKIRELEKLDGGRVFVALAHDSFLVDTMPLYPEKMNGWSSSAWKKDLESILGKFYK